MKKKIIRYTLSLLQGLLLSGMPLIALTACTTHDGPPRRPINPASIKKAHPHLEPLSRYGNPPYYDVFGRRYYVLHSAEGYDKQGLASWYGCKFHGHLTSMREPFNMYAMTAASRTLPLPTYVRVTNLENGRHVIVRVNDRGPFSGDIHRIIDLSYAAAVKLGCAKKGLTHVRVTALNLAQKIKKTISKLKA